MNFWNDEYKTNKSWCLKLDAESSKLSAVDAKTGDYIGDFLNFSKDGEVLNCESFKDVLVVGGYDPHEHNNRFDDIGRMIIS